MYTIYTNMYVDTIVEVSTYKWSTHISGQKICHNKIVAYLFEYETRMYTRSRKARKLK